MQLPPGQSLSKDAANDLLRKNARLPYGSWAIKRSGDNDYLVLFDTCIAQSMQPRDFEMTVRMMAITADEKEKTFGVDVY